MSVIQFVRAVPLDDEVTRILPKLLHEVAHRAVLVPVRPLLERRPLVRGSQRGSSLNPNPP